MYGQGSQGMAIDELMTKRHVMSVIPMMMKRTIVKPETSASTGLGRPDTHWGSAISELGE
jgi:hypothetical protein